MTVTSALTDSIVQRLLGVTRAERIILFGSTVTGQVTADSDLDLLVVESNPQDVRAESVRLRAALRGLGIPVDVVVMASGTYEESKNVVGGLAYPAHKYGRVLYAAP